MTEILPATDTMAVNKAVELLNMGDVVVFPTDTIYGIAASITTKSGVDKIYDVKSRSRDKPIMIYVTCLKQFGQVVSGVCSSTLRALQQIWPGAMAGIFIKNDDVVPDYVTSGKKTVAVRIPDHPFCLDLVGRVGHPVVVTSANVSGMETRQTAHGVAEQLGKRVPLVLDGGPSRGNDSSTLVDFTGTTPTLLRKGALSFSQLQQFLPDLERLSEN